MKETYRLSSLLSNLKSNTLQFRFRTREFRASTSPLPSPKTVQDADDTDLLKEDPPRESLKGCARALPERRHPLRSRRLRQRRVQRAVLFRTPLGASWESGAPLFRPAVQDERLRLSTLCCHRLQRRTGTDRLLGRRQRTPKRGRPADCSS